MVIIILDPTGEDIPKVTITSGQPVHTVWTTPTPTTHPPHQAHLPTLVLLWMSGVMNPVVYVVFNPLYRSISM